MQKHTLTESDGWFIEKGQVDSLSRTPFDVGHEIVVCDHKHVMLAEFYDGSCPTCHSTVTVAFGHSAVEYPKPPKPKEEFLKWFFPTKVALKVVPKINVSLSWILGILAMTVVVLIMTGMLSNELILYRVETSLVPKTELLLSQMGGFWLSDNTAEKFKSSVSVMITRNKIIFENSVDALSLPNTGALVLLTTLWSGLQSTLNKSKVLYEFVDMRTQTLIVIITNWFYDLIDMTGVRG